MGWGHSRGRFGRRGRALSETTEGVAVRGSSGFTGPASVALLAGAVIASLSSLFGSSLASASDDYAHGIWEYEYAIQVNGTVTALRPLGNGTWVYGNYGDL